MQLHCCSRVMSVAIKAVLVSRCTRVESSYCKHSRPLVRPCRLYHAVKCSYAVAAMTIDAESSQVGATAVHCQNMSCLLLGLILCQATLQYTHLFTAGRQRPASCTATLPGPADYSPYLQSATGLHLASGKGIGFSKAARYPASHYEVSRWQ